MPVHHDIAAEAAYWDANAPQAADDLRPTFGWTQYPGHGPGPELLRGPASVLELGCGDARALAHLSARGIRATGIDLSTRTIQRAATRWAAFGMTLLCADAQQYLETTETDFDAIYSISGAAYYSDPRKLLPLIARRLSPGGVVVIAHPAAISGTYGPQGTYLDGPAGRAEYFYSYAFTPRTWIRMCESAGLQDADACVIPAPKEGHVGTLLVTAHGMRVKRDAR